MNVFRPFLACQNAMICEHDNLEQPLEFSPKIAQACRYILHLLHVRSMRSHICLRIAAQRFFPCLHTLGIAFYRWSTLMQCFYSPINSFLHFLPLVENMPNIPLMKGIRGDFAHCTPDRFPSIGNDHTKRMPVIFHLQQQDAPALPVHGHWGTACMDKRCMGVHDIQIGFSWAMAIWLINGQISHPFRNLLIEPLLGSLARLMKD